MSISDEQWTQIQSALEGHFGMCEFEIEGCAVSIVRVPWSEGQRALCVYIDNKFNLGWGRPNSDKFRDITTRIWRKRSMHVYSPTEKKKLIKDFGIRRARRLFPSLDEKIVWYEPAFMKASPLARQLKKLPADSVKLISIGGEAA